MFGKNHKHKGEPAASGLSDLPESVTAIDRRIEEVDAKIREAVSTEDYALAERLKEDRLQAQADRAAALEEYRAEQERLRKDEEDRKAREEFARQARHKARRGRRGGKGADAEDEYDAPTVGFVTDPAATSRIIPFEYMFDDGICRIDEGSYSQAIEFDDVNYQAARPDEQKDVRDSWSEFLNGLDDDVSIQLLLVSKRIDQHTFMEELSMRDVLGDDGGNTFRREFNALVQSKLAAAAKSMRRTRVIVITVAAPTHDKASRKLALVSERVKRLFTTLDSSCRVLDGQARIDLICQLTRQDELPGKVRFEDLEASPGLRVRDLVAPGRVLRLDDGDLVVGSRYVRTYVVTDYAKTTRDDFLSNLTQLSYDVAVSMHVKPWDYASSLAFAETHLNDVISENTQYMQNSSKPERGYFVDHDTLPRRMRDAEAQADAVLDELANQDQRLFALTTTVTVFGHDAEELAAACAEVEDVFREQRFGCVEHWDCLREQSFSTTLPVGSCLVPYERNLHTLALAGYVPFTSVEVMDQGGIYMGINADTHNFILYDRERQEDSNCFVLGQPGGGKSVSAKLMISQLRLRHPDDDVICIDPEGEYARAVEALGGTVVNVSESSLDYINPLDMSDYYGSEDGVHKGNPLPLKVSFVQTLIHMMASSVSDEERNVIDAACSYIFQPYLASGDEADVPTLQDLYEYLKHVEGTTSEDARHLVTLLYMWVDGTIGVFNHRTNVDLGNNCIDYVISGLGATLKPVAMLILLDQVWVRVTKNRREGRRTWLFIDEIQLLLDDEEAVDWLDKFWGRGRKWGLYCTGATQNIDRLLDNETTRYMVQNTPFLVLLVQSSKVAEAIGGDLGLSRSQIRILKTSPKGEGLYVFRHKVIHFDANVPARICPKLYAAITTKFSEVSAPTVQDSGDSATGDVPTVQSPEPDEAPSGLGGGRDFFATMAAMPRPMRVGIDARSGE